jgi:hypothetical protein
VVDVEDPKHGLCAACHAGPMLNETNRFEDVLTQYTNFFQIVTNGAIQLTDQDRKDVVAFLKLLD